MVYRFEDKVYQLAYAESEVRQPVLWESHCHAQFEMILVGEGDITVTVEGKRYRLKKNQGVVIPPLLYHTVTANETGSYRRVTTLFGMDGIPEVLRPKFVQRGECPAIRFSYQPDRLKELCQKEDQGFYAPLVQSMMVQLFYDILQETQSTIYVETDEFVQKAIQYIDKHLHEKIRIDDLARHTARSASSFCWLFKKKMNVTPKQYILQKKLALARKLIDEGVPHTVAAMQVGYENYSSFYRLYSKDAEVRRKSVE